MTAVNEATSVRTPTNGQRLFLGYTLFILVDLAVLNVFDEYWYRVEIDSFTISLLAAALLQVLLRLTLALEHRLANFFKEKGGKRAKTKRVFTTWMVLLVSKFVMLEAINVVFGDRVEFGGVIPFIVVVIAIIIAETILSKIYAMLADEPISH